MHLKLRSLLRHADLSEEEITIYLSLLKYGTSTMPEITAKTKLPNITVYRTLQKLEEVKLVGAVPINNKQKQYTALTLDALIQRIQKDQRSLRKLELSLKEMNPLLSHMDIENDMTEEMRVHKHKTRVSRRESNSVYKISIQFLG